MNKMQILFPEIQPEYCIKENELRIVEKYEAEICQEESSIEKVKDCKIVHFKNKCTYCNRPTDNLTTFWFGNEPTCWRCKIIATEDLGVRHRVKKESDQISKHGHHEVCCPCCLEKWTISKRSKVDKICHKCYYRQHLIKEGELRFSKLYDKIVTYNEAQANLVALKTKSLSKRNRHSPAYLAAEEYYQNFLNEMKGHLPTPVFERLRRYGLDFEEWEGMALSQGGLCAICGEAPDQNHLRPDLHIDHCHAAEEEDRVMVVRGLLCVRCNTHVLPALRDDPQIAQAAADYLLNGQRLRQKKKLEVALAVRQISERKRGYC